MFSDAETSSLRARYSGSSFRPRCPSVWFCTRRRTSSRAVLPNRTMWNGSATCFACGSAVSNAARYGPERSSTPQRIPVSQLRGRRCIHRTAVLAVLPGTMSNSWPRRTSTMLVAQALVRHRPRRPRRGAEAADPSPKTPREPQHVPAVKRMEP